MAKRTIPKNRFGASTEHALSRLLHQCGFRGVEGDAKKFLAICRRVAGKNGNLIISAKNLGISPREMYGIADNEFSVAFYRGKAPTVLQLAELK